MLDDRPEAQTGSDGALDGPVEHPDAQELTFPDLPRLELDQLLAQLVERAQEVMATQGRLRGLLRANHMITGGLALPVVLHRIVEAARELVGARYAALGVLAPDGGLAEFVHVGLPADLVDRIGHLPEGKGLLGALIDDPRPIRLPRTSPTTPARAGFPPSHPPMSSFLGVPIRIRDEVFGNLYLAESTRGRVQRRGRGTHQGPRRHRRRRDRQRPPLRGRPPAGRVAAGHRRHHSRDPRGRTRRPGRFAAPHRRAQPGGRRRRPRDHRAPRRRPGRGPAGLGGRRRQRRRHHGPRRPAERLAVRAGVHDRDSRSG